MAMTHRERAIVALEKGQPDFVPHFELAFHETERDFQGRSFYGAPKAPDFDSVAYEEAINHNARLHVDLARHFEHSIICLTATKPQKYSDFTRAMQDLGRAIREISGDEFLIMAHGDATFAIPDGDGMVEFSLRIAEDMDGLKAEAENRVREMLKHCRLCLEAGIDGFVLCSDYAFNNGPFVSPAMFEELIAPYLKRLISGQREMGAWVIKHSDGNLMAILDAIVDAQPHALHSIDPMAGMDIAQIKKDYGDRIALCGNVHCAWMQTGTTEQVRKSAEYCMKNQYCSARSLPFIDLGARDFAFRKLGTFPRGRQVAI